MDTGIYVALSKEIGIFNDMNVTANNIANVTTTGFQGESLLFSQFLTPTTKEENKVAFANDISTFRDMTQGTLQQTGGALDAAIQGKGYFVVQTPLGIRYTRNGNFKVNANGNLSTSEGYLVLDESSQPVAFDEIDRVIEIRNDGTINVDQTPRATLKIVQFDNDQLLHRLGNTLYSSDAPSHPAQDFQVISGALERSNVQSFAELTHMMQVSRDAASVAKYISTVYTLEKKASDTLAKIYS